MHEQSHHHHSGKYSFMRRGGLAIIGGILILAAYFHVFGQVMQYFLPFIAVLLIAKGIFGIIQSLKAQ